MALVHGSCMSTQMPRAPCSVLLRLGIGTRVPRRDPRPDRRALPARPRRRTYRARRARAASPRRGRQRLGRQRLGRQARSATAQSRRPGSGDRTLDVDRHGARSGREPARNSRAAGHDRRTLSRAGLAGSQPSGDQEPNRRAGGVRLVDGLPAHVRPRHGSRDRTLPRHRHAGRSEDPHGPPVGGDIDWHRVDDSSDLDEQKQAWLRYVGSDRT